MLKRDDNVQGEDRRKKIKIQLINKSLTLEDNIKNIDPRGTHCSCADWKALNDESKIRRADCSAVR